MRMVAAFASAAAICAASLPASAAAESKSLAGKQWHYQAQVDGIGEPDQIDIMGGKDLAKKPFGTSGHFTVTVHLAGTGTTVSKRLELSYYYSPRKPWTPWYGATQLDHLGGNELLFGATSGAHTQIYQAITYRNGALHSLRPPAATSNSWGVNASYGSGSQGWRCTPGGVQSRSVYPSANRQQFRIVRNAYVWRNGAWARVTHVAKSVKAPADGGFPKHTDGYARFDCSGLPGS